jgi:hypothetical protein
VARARIQVPPAFPAIDQVFRRAMNLAFEGQQVVEAAAETIKRAAAAPPQHDAWGRRRTKNGCPYVLRLAPVTASSSRSPIRRA